MRGTGRSLLTIDRFDLRTDGSYRGYEDFCVLNARRTEEKYRGSYETSILKRYQGETRVGCTPAKAKQLLRKVEGAMRDTMKAVQSYVQHHPEFSEIGGRMLAEWENGITLSLREG